METKTRPAFVKLTEHDGGKVSFWLHNALLPELSDALESCQHSSLQNFSTACNQVFRDEKQEYSNQDCSICKTDIEAINPSIKKTEIFDGVLLTFQKNVVEAVSNALLSSQNKALEDIGSRIKGFIDRRKLNGEV